MVNYLEKISTFLNQLLLWVGGITLVGMILLTCSNIFLRVVWIPIRGTFELMGFFGAIVAGFALGYTQIKRGHIAVDILVNQFPQKTQAILNSINYFICMIFFAIAAWQIAKWATILWRTGEITETLRIIYFPFTYGLALGCAVLSLVLLTDLLKSFMQDKDLNT
ncbi:MAG: TRAP transporter small permease subunit [Deltaproteobacteria bacterium]|nr:TRAP transporter small permease subunit [Deltaproteobacteria bacterium]